ncbi:nucleotidyltransferase domain-containing protein [Paractinoplanes lichenicola]|uniref:Nucleotidyltransferase domain-containing protein n=1 Tax=Paractinoplanes lichenicola TaxID=2802976 RepID=A0ABS1W4V6_9ACTN|nr:nucleotidyltransferase domain-containing protein [Actinoplanes lichenicola]MBL7261588.1 nucleotidyltransferase domain-containing protein [Actinoplanes lichenicola]
MDRERAMAMVEGVLKHLIDGADEWPLSMVDEVYVFGSFARGALQPGDVDLLVEFHGDDPRWDELVIEGLSYGRDPHRVLRAAMVGRKRGVQFLFNARRRVDFDLTLLWQRGDDLATALTRLHAIAADPNAGRAERHAMLPQFEGLDHRMPRSVREYLIEGIEAGAITVERLTLQDRDIDHPLVDKHVHSRWSPASPLHRAGRAVFANLLERGLDPAQLHLHGRDVDNIVTPYFAGFSLRYLRSMARCLTEFEGKEWLEVVNPTRTKDLDALRILPGSPAALERLSRVRL